MVDSATDLSEPTSEEPAAVSVETSARTTGLYLFGAAADTTLMLLPQRLMLTTMSDTGSGEGPLSVFITTDAPFSGTTIDGPSPPILETMPLPIKLAKTSNRLVAERS